MKSPIKINSPRFASSGMPTRKNILVNEISEAEVVTMESLMQVGDVMTANAEKLSDAAATYQWQRDGVDISGATASSYTLVAGDSDNEVRVVVTSNGTDYPSRAITVAASATVAAPETSIT